MDPSAQNFRTAGSDSTRFLGGSNGPETAPATAMKGIGRRFVYILRSDSNPSCHYVGLTSDVQSRLDWHNAGPSGHTVTHRPWSIVVSLEFPEEQAAVQFERYLKSGSGRTFAKRNFGSNESGHRQPDSVTSQLAFGSTWSRLGSS
jgi:predicted GIY-YIG superfamily endonuclease